MDTFHAVSMSKPGDPEKFSLNIHNLKKMRKTKFYMVHYLRTR